MVGDLLGEAHVHAPFETLEILRKDSLDLTDADRESIVEAIASAPHTRVVVTHGTDTMTKTARVLRQIAGKTIVLTGASRPRDLRTPMPPLMSAWRSAPCRRCRPASTSP